MASSSFRQRFWGGQDHIYLIERHFWHPYGKFIGKRSRADLVELVGKL